MTLLSAHTVDQPKASLIVLGHIRVFTVARPVAVRGRVAIVASNRKPRRGRHQYGEFELDNDGGGLLLRGDKLAWPYRLPQGVVVGTVDLVDCVPIIANTDGRTIVTPCAEWAGPGYLREWYEGEDGGMYHRMLHDQAPYDDFTIGRHVCLLANPKRIRRSPSIAPSKGWPMIDLDIDEMARA